MNQHQQLEEVFREVFNLEDLILSDATTAEDIPDGTPSRISISCLVSNKPSMFASMEMNWPNLKISES